MHPVIEIIVAAALIFIGLLHAYCATGGVWPARDSASLADLVIGRQPMPGRSPCLVVALAMFLAAGVFIRLATGTTNLVPHLAAGVMAVIFLMRGVIGFFDSRMRPAIRGSRYERMNVILYSPACLVLSVLAVLASAS